MFSAENIRTRNLPESIFYTSQWIYPMDICLHIQVYSLLVDVPLPIFCNTFERSANFRYFCKVQNANLMHKVECGPIEKLTIFISWLGNISKSVHNLGDQLPRQTFQGYLMHLKLNSRGPNRTILNDPVEGCHWFSDKSALECLWLRNRMRFGLAVNCPRTM